MPSLDGLLIVSAVAFAAPFLLGLAPGLRIPAVVLELVAGIVVGPSVLGWVALDPTLEVMAALGLAFLLFIAGLEVDVARLRGPVLRATASGYAISLALAVLVALALSAGGLVQTPLLGAFAAGAVLTLADPDEAMTHPDLRRKLEAIGFGVFIPVFFVVSGIRFDLGALTDNVAMVPLFLAALLLVRGLPALLYRHLLDSRRTLVAGILQATSLPFIVAASA